MSAQAVFGVFAALAVLGALGTITSRNPVSSVLWLVVTMFQLAGIFVLLNAQFIAAIQILVYAGAVMVLFLFVIMLLNLGRGGPRDMRGPPARLFALLIGATLVAELGILFGLTPGGLVRALGIPTPAATPLDVLPAAREALAATASRGVVGAVAAPLFEVYLVPFEITSILLLAAAVGAVVLAKRRL